MIAPTATPPAHQSMEGQSTQGHSDYNFLKRKLNDEDTPTTTAAAATINNNNVTDVNQRTEINNFATGYSFGEASNTTVSDEQLWKRQHLDDDGHHLGANSLISSATPCRPSPEIDLPSYHSSPLPGFTPITSQDISATISAISTTTAAAGASTATYTGDMTFNLIDSSFLLNDFFTYDANLIPVSVPVTVSPVPTCETTTFNTPSSMGANRSSIGFNANEDVGGGGGGGGGDNDDNDPNNWQATDLLELDHRYNSGLQTEISQLQPTLPLTTPPTVTTALPMARNDNSDSAFLMPQKQIIVPARPLFGVSSSTTTTTTAATHQRFAAPQHQPSPPNHDLDTPPSEADSDFEDKNLLWLLNFKFDEFPHLSPDVAGGQQSKRKGPQAHTVSPLTNSSTTKSSSVISPVASLSGGNALTAGAAAASGQSQSSDRSRSPKSTSRAGRKFEELVLEVTSETDGGGDMVVAENVIVEDTALRTQKKPPFTYTELIEYALEDKGELTVSGIYQWISDRFPYYKSNDDRWKNSVRHNLSINPHFRKGIKSAQGAGHLWTISSGDSAENVLAWEHKKQRLELFFKMEAMNRERLLQHRQQQQREQQLDECQTNCHGGQHGLDDQSPYRDEAAAAAATIAQEMLASEPASVLQADNSTAPSARPAIQTAPSNHHNHHHHSHQPNLPFNDLMSDEELRKTAGQILNGIHREVEVQSVNAMIGSYHDVLLDNDYLNPIHKDVSVTESIMSHSHGSLHNHLTAHSQAPPSNGSSSTPSNASASTSCGSISQYYVTDIDPLELGIHMSHQVEEEVLLYDEFNLNYFSYNAGNDIVA